MKKDDDDKKKKDAPTKKKTVFEEFKNDKDKKVQLQWASQLLHNLKPKTFVPMVYYIGEEIVKEKIKHNFATGEETFLEKPFKVMIMEMLGPSLEHLIKHCRRFDLKTTCLVAIQMIQRLETVHEEGLILRDIKPSNFMLGGCALSKDKLHCSDLALAKYYMVNGKHIKLTSCLPPILPMMPFTRICFDSWKKTTRLSKIKKESPKIVAYLARLLKKLAK